MFRRIGTMALACVLGLALGGRMQAHEKDRYHGGSLDARNHGYEHGYRDGFYHGREDLNRHAGYDYKAEDYKHGDRGYEHYMGKKEDYKKGYREGYRAGYDDAYRRRAGRFGDIYGYPGAGGAVDRGRDMDREDDIYAQRGWGYSDVAYDIGYRDGVQAGQDDSRGGRSFNPEGHDRFRAADHGYRSEYGSKSEYQRSYRDAYLRGYQDGYGRWR